MKTPKLPVVCITLITLAIATKLAFCESPPDAEDTELAIGTNEPVKLQSVAKQTGDLLNFTDGGKALITLSSNRTLVVAGKVLGRLVGTNWIAAAPDTNATMALPFVRQALHQAWGEGAQFAISAAIQNKTLVQMQDAQGLYKAAMFLRFGESPRKP